MKNLKKLLGAAAVLLLVGQGCGAKTDTQVEVTPPVAEPAVPATPPSDPPGGSAEPAQPATPPVVDVDVSLKASATITAGGAFSPATLTVKKGTTVTWTNAGSAKVWIASDPHPIHTGYPGFDSRTDLGAGESFSFTFDKVGTWGYHNHLNSTVKGTVVVTE